MFSFLTRLRHLGLTCVLLSLTAPLWARTQISFSKVEASHYAGDITNLERIIDGRNTSPTGWGLGGQLNSPQSVIFTTQETVYADILELSLCFMSGRPHSTFANFSVSFTTDAIPSEDGNWTPLPILNLSAITCELTVTSDNRIRAEETSAVTTGMIPDDVYRISTRLPNKAVTGFRIEAYPVLRSLHPAKEQVMAWGNNGDFILTEFRAEVLSTTTNVALGAPATATHPLFETSNPIYLTTPQIYREMKAAAITDGWPSTLAHPGENITDKNFHFEIDLGQQRNINHVVLRQRGDSYQLDRFGKMWIKLYEEDPKTGAAPTWQAFNRPDGSYPVRGEIDILHAADGKGDFNGRYIRISSDNPVPYSPQLAEIEVYETRTPRLISIIADDLALSKKSPLRIPPAIGRLGFQFEIPQTGQPLDRLYRWKLAGMSKGWKTSNSLLLEIACPPAGNHHLELQAAHSDGTWDASVLEVPFVVDVRFTETAAFLWLIGGATLIIGILIARYFALQKINQLEAQSALSAERSRIAANMHDDVGARLAQIAVLHDVLAAEHDLSPAASSDLSKLTNYARGTMAALDEAVWAVNPRNNTITALATFLMQHADNYLQPLGIACKSECPHELPQLSLRTGTRHEVALTFKEALQNIVKHAKANEVVITLNHEPGQFTININDNGCGFSKEPRAPGQDGLNNMQKRMTSIGGTCEWLPNEKGGTTVKIKFPLT